MKRPKHINIDYVKNKLKINNPKIIILSENCENSKTKIKFKCLKDNYEWDTTWDCFSQSYKCPKCSNSIKNYTINDIKSILKENNSNIEILDNEYFGNNKKMRFKCNLDGYIWESTWSNFSRKYQCPECVGKRKDYTIKDIKEKLFKINNNIEILSEEYINSDTKLKCRCKIDGYEWESTWRNLSQGKNCIECYFRNNTGKNHYLYNENLTDKDREIGRRFLDDGEISIDVWRNSIFKRDNYMCVICGKNSKNLNAHHKNGYHWDIDNRYNIDNGVTLCKECHRKFHKKYGTKNNTEEQFLEFYNNGLAVVYEKK